MVDGLQLLDKDCLGILDITESDRTLAEVAVSHLSVNESFYQAAYGLFGVGG